MHVTDSDGRLLPETRDVLRAIARHELILATGHLARDDTFAVVDGALEEGVADIVVTHPEFPCQNFSLDDQRALAERGCLLERCLSTPLSGKTDWEHVFDGVRAVGTERTLFERLREPGLPARRGRARALGRPPARRRVRRGRGARDDRGAVAAAGRRRMTRRLLVIGAHSADFVWRAGGAVAVATSNGGAARVLALSYGERGESGELWKEPDQTVERVKEIRHGEAERAAAALGAEFECLDLGDYPLEIDGDALVAIADRIRAFAPDVVSRTRIATPSTRTTRPRSSPSRRRVRSRPGPASRARSRPSKPPELLLFEPHQPELCNFTPTTFVDITPVIERKNAAMAEMKAQSYLHPYYSQRAEQRGNHARRSSGNSAIRYAEAFQRVTPQVVSEL